MKMPAPYLKRALATALSGNIVVNATNIPYYEREGHLVPTQVVFINDSYDGSASNKNGFVYRSTFVLDVVTIKNDPTSKLADLTAEAVCNLIKPDTISGELLTGTDFQIMIQGGPKFDPLTEDSISGEKVFRRLITFNALIIER